MGRCCTLERLWKMYTKWWSSYHTVKYYDHYNTIVPAISFSSNELYNSHLPSTKQFSPWSYDPSQSSWSICPSALTILVKRVMVGWKVHRLSTVQWSKLTFFHHKFSCGPHTPPLVLQCLDSRGIEALILILKKVLNCRYDLIISPILLPSQLFFHVGEQLVPNQENMEGDQSVQSHSHIQQPLQPQTCVQEHCPGETRLPLSLFHIHVMSLVLQLFNILNYPVWVYLEGNNAIKVELNCQ